MLYYIVIAYGYIITYIYVCINSCTYVYINAYNIN